MVETIPTLTYGTVTGRFLAAVVDSPDDSDTHPDGVPLTGTVIFTPSAKAVLIAGVGTVLPVAIEATLDADGYISVNGTRGVELIASDSPAVNPVGFTYAVSFRNLRYGASNSVAYSGFNILVPAGETIDLSVVAPVPVSGGTPIVRGPAGPAGPPGDAEAAVQSVAGRTGDVTLTKSDVGLNNVNNTADSDKPVSEAQAIAISSKYSKPSTGIPLSDLTSGIQTSLGKADTALQSAPVSSVAGRTGAVTLTKTDVGLSNVDNTADTDKPVSTAQASAIGAKYTKPGSGIPASDLATAVQTSLGKADSALQSAPVTSVAGRTGAVTLSKSDVGLGNVDNTSDANKPVSSATQTALNLKVGSADSSVLQIVKLTQSAYDALTTKVATTVYVIVG